MSMQAEVERLAQKIVEQYKTVSSDRRLLVAVAGPPGSGKSTLAYPLTDRINALLLNHPAPHPSQVDPIAKVAIPARDAGQDDEIAICVGLDAWHHSRKELDEFEDPTEAHWRRGAPFTFNLPSYHTFLSLLRLPLTPNPPVGIPFPTFDHSIKDPMPSPFPISPRHHIILIEGLYTLFTLPGWKECAEMMDVGIWVESERSVVRERLVRRNFAAGIVDDQEKCKQRVDAVDMVNGDQVRENRLEPTDIVVSIEEPQPSS